MFGLNRSNTTSVIASSDPGVIIKDLFIGIEGGVNQAILHESGVTGATLGYVTPVVLGDGNSLSFDDTVLEAWDFEVESVGVLYDTIPAIVGYNFTGTPPDLNTGDVVNLTGTIRQRDSWADNFTDTFHDGTVTFALKGLDAENATVTTRVVVCIDELGSCANTVDTSGYFNTSITLTHSLIRLLIETSSIMYDGNN